MERIFERMHEKLLVAAKFQAVPILTSSEVTVELEHTTSFATSTLLGNNVQLAQLLERIINKFICVTVPWDQQLEHPASQMGPNKVVALI